MSNLFNPKNASKRMMLEGWVVEENFFFLYDEYIEILFTCHKNT